MSENNGTANWIRWAVGIVFGIISSVAGYSLTMAIDVESRLSVIESNSGLSAADAATLATLENDMEQVKEELVALWQKYNTAQGDKGEWINAFGELKGRILLLEYEINHLHD